jgi:hypothetical protein
MKACLAVSLALIAFIAGRATGAGVVHPGMIPYTPSQLEWLELQCWITVKEDTVENSSGSGLMIDTLGRAPDTIILHVRYMPNEDRAVMNKIIENKKQLIHATAKGYKWDSWLKVEEDVAPLMQ